MATTENTYTNTTDATHSFTFPYLQKSDVKVSIRDDDGQVDELTKDATNGYTVQTTTITLTGTAASGLTAADTVRIYRETAAALPATFYPGSAIRSSDLNDNFTQNLYTTQEVVERYLDSKGGFLASTLTLGEDADLVFEGASDDVHEATLTVVDPTADRTIKLPNQSGTVPVLAAESTTQITSTPEELNILDGVTADKDEINKLNGATASTTELNYVTGVTSSIQTQLDARQPLDAELTELATMGSNTAAALADLTQAEVQILGGATVSTDELNILDGVTASTADINLIDGVTNGTVSASKAIITDANKDITGGRNITITGELSAASYTGTGILTDGVNATASDTKLLSSEACDERYFKQSSSETLKDGVSWVSTDAYIATAAAIDDRVASLVNEVGGFVAIANEGSFPTTNPDIENNTGTIVSITALSADRTASGSGVLTTGFTTTGSAAVTITGCTNNQVYKQGYGLQVETTSTLNTYTFVRYVPQTSDVTAVAANVSNISTVAGIEANVTKVADIDSNVTTVAGIDSNVTTVAGIQANVTTVAGIQANVTTVAGISGNVTTVAGNNANVTTCATNISNINGASGHAATASTKATEAALSASAAATSASSAANAVTQINTLSYYKDFGSIADAASTTTDYGAIA